MTLYQTSVFKGMAIVLGMLLAISTQAQSPSVVLDKMVAHYNGQQQLQYTMNIGYFESLSTDKPDYTASLQVNQDHTATYIDITGEQQHLEQYLSNTAILEVDHQAQTVYYHPINDEASAATQPSALQGILDLAATEGIALTAIERAGKPGLRLAAPQASGTTIDLFYDQDYRIIESHLIVDVPTERYQGAMNGKKIICQFEYKGQLTKKGLADFIQGTGQGITLSSRLKDYTLLR